MLATLQIWTYDRCRTVYQAFVIIAVQPEKNVESIMADNTCLCKPGGLTTVIRTKQPPQRAAQRVTVRLD